QVTERLLVDSREPALPDPAPAQPPGDSEAEQVHDPVPVDLQRPEGQGDRVDLVQDGHRVRGVRYVAIVIVAERRARRLPGAWAAAPDPGPASRRRPGWPAGAAPAPSPRGSAGRRRWRRRSSGQPAGTAAGPARAGSGSPPVPTAAAGTAGRHAAGDTGPSPPSVPPPHPATLPGRAGKTDRRDPAPGRGLRWRHAPVPVRRPPGPGLPR